METTTPAQETKSEYLATLGEQDFYVTVARYADGITWVRIEEYVLPPVGHGWNRAVMPSINVVDCHSDLEAIREAFHDVRGRMKAWVRSWRNYVEWAAKEKGGKRAYYTKHANEAKRLIPPAAANWKLCKQIWKQITKL